MHCMMLKWVVKSTHSSTYHVFLMKTSQNISLGLEINKLYVMCPQQPTTWWPLGLLILTAGFDFV